MSLPLLPLDGEEPQQASEKASAVPQPELKAEAEDAVSPEEHAETELPEPEATVIAAPHERRADAALRAGRHSLWCCCILVWCRMGCCPPWRRWTRMRLGGTLCCKPAAAGSKPVRGLPGAARRPERPARTVFFRDDAGAAAVAALVQAVTAMLNANVYRGTTGISLLSGMAALGLFLVLLGSRVMLAAVKGGYELVTNGGVSRRLPRQGQRPVARPCTGSGTEGPWVLLSCPMKEADGFVEQSLSERASERRARKVSYILLGVALLSGVLFLLAGAGWNKAAAAMAAVLCMGAPLSSTLIAGVAPLRLQRAAAAVGAVVPGWQAIEQLGGIDTLQIDADDLFTADSAQLEDIRIFKGGRIDRAILYAASVLNESHGTLKGLFRQDR